MATLSGQHGDLKAVLRGLIDLDADASTAYRASANRVEHPQLVRFCEAFQGDHERHEREIRQALRELGEASCNDEVREVLSTSKIAIGRLAGARGILNAMLANERQINLAYELALCRTDLTPALKSLIERACDDERRHKNCLEGQLSFLGAEQSAFR